MKHQPKQDLEGWGSMLSTSICFARQAGYTLVRVKEQKPFAFTAIASRSVRSLKKVFSWKASSSHAIIYERRCTWNVK